MVTCQHPPAWSQGRNARGQSAATFAGLWLFFGVTVALVVDVGALMIRTRLLQTVTEGATFAAAQAVDESELARTGVLVLHPGLAQAAANKVVASNSGGVVQVTCQASGLSVICVGTTTVPSALYRVLGQGGATLTFTQQAEFQYGIEDDIGP